jgi:ABC-type hemin transport system substrate-binding protein
MDSGPPQIFEQLRNSGITVLTLTPNYTVETVKAKVQTIAKALSLDAKGAEINNTIGIFYPVRRCSARAFCWRRIWRREL